MVTDEQILDGLYNTSAPQDWALDVRPVEMTLQKELDSDLRIIWNPKAYLTHPGHYDVSGKAIPPTYDGRYQVVIKGKRDGVTSIVWTVGTEEGTERHYKAIGPWLVEFMRIWDSQNVERMDALRKMQDEQEALKEALTLNAAQRRQEETERFATDVLGMKPIRSVVPANLTQ